MVNDIIAKNANIEVDGFSFVAEEITATESYPRRELIRTAIMGGGQQTSRGQYVPRTYSFTTSVDYTVATPDEFDKVWAEMENKNCNVICQYTGNFVAEVKIDKVYPKGTLNNVNLTVTLTEISQADNTVTVKTDMGGFTTITDNSETNVVTGEDKDGNSVTLQKNISDKYTKKMSANFKKVSETKVKQNVKDSQKKTSNTSESKTVTTTKVVNPTTNTETYVSKTVTVKI